MVTLEQRILTFLTLFAIISFENRIYASTGFGYDIRMDTIGKSETDNNREPDGKAIINELMVDPSPVVGLPDFEWIELFNPGSSRIHLAGWSIMVGSTGRSLNNTWIEPGEYIILCSAAASTSMAGWGRVIVINLPALRNTGNLIRLFDANNALVDQVNYSDTWYRDAKKRNGGWTLERIDPLRDCGESANWTASRDARGGTPGERNSVFAENFDRIPPGIVWAGLVAPHTAEIIFSEPMDTITLMQKKNYLITGVGEPVNVVLKNESAVLLQWHVAMQINISFALVIDNLSDVCGNPLARTSLPVQWVELAGGDVIVNEVLFNPMTGGVDFVEFLNCSDKRIDAGKLIIAGRDKNRVLRQQVTLKSMNRLIEPGEYFAVTIDRSTLMSQYYSQCQDCIYQLPSMPAYNNDEGWVVLMDESQLILDEFHYTEKMHHKLLHQVKGVSLERIHPDKPAFFSDNWQSAASEVGYATPGYKNSQYRQDESVRPKLRIHPEAFSPNGDGYHEELWIEYQTPHPGWVGNAWIFDANGRYVMQLLKNQLLAVMGKLSWNGTDPTGSRVSSGPYILAFEMYNLEGSIYKFRNAFFIAGSNH